MSIPPRPTARLIAALSSFLCAWLVLIGVSGTAHAAAVHAAPAATTVDGIAVGYLPPGLGPASDFVYDYDDVDFVSRTWESARPGGGYRVDLDLVVMRGARLTDGRSFHDWYVAYQDRPADEARYLPVSVHGRPGWLGRDEIFWLERPGLAVSARLDGTRWSTLDVARLGWSAHEVHS